MKPLPNFARLLQTAELPELGPGPRAAVRPAAELNRELDRELSDSALKAETADLVRALVLLWHDHLEPAHVLAQAVSNRDGSYVHAILHRREPDYGNAKYWFRRVGAHSCYDLLAARAAGLLREPAAEALARKILPRGQWDAFAFVDACEAAVQQPGASGGNAARCPREVQALEFRVLLDYLAGGVAR